MRLFPKRKKIYYLQHEDNNEDALKKAKCIEISMFLGYNKSVKNNPPLYYKDWNELMFAWNTFHRFKLMPLVKDKEKRPMINEIVKDMRSALKWVMIETAFNTLYNAVRTIQKTTTTDEKQNDVQQR